MTQREKILAWAVGALVLSIGGFWLLGYVSDAFDTRNDELATLQQTKSDNDSKIRRGERASKQLADWEKRSLSSDVNRAQTDYRFWLHEATRKAGLVVDVKPLSSRHGQRDLFVRHSFNISGEVDARKLIQFFHDFYNVGYLHRISSAAISPVKDKKLLEVVIVVECLSLNKAPVTASTTPPAVEKPLEKTAEQYAEAIIRRNYFAPANNPPKISSMSTQRGNPNKTLSFTVKAIDPDKLDSITYKLESSTIDGAKIDSKTGEFRVSPTKIGEYEVQVRATDDGVPAKSVVEKVKIAIAAAPVPPKENPYLKDDPARDARITAVVGPTSKLQVWVVVPRGMGDQPKTLHLNAGDKISVGSFKGVVKKIREREAEFHLDDGRTVVVRLEKPLVPSDKDSGGL